MDNDCVTMHMNVSVRRYCMNVIMCVCDDRSGKTRGGGGNVLRMIRDGVADTQLSTPINSLFG
jgi:hypothetical protein